MSDSELIKRDVLKFFNLDENKQKELGEYGRELIKKEYSVTRMADDSIKVYDWALQKNKEILISGYYCFKNSGDDALLQAIINDLKQYKESPNIVVLSANPDETMEYYKVKSINRLNVLKIAKHMKKADMLISGGGTLIQDRTSTKSLWYYLTVIAMAKKKNMKVMLYSNGIGPLERKGNIKKPKLVKAILKNEGVPSDKKLLGVSVRKWQNLGSDFETQIANACDYAYEKYGYYTVFLPMQSSRDTAIMQNIKRKMKHESAIIKKRYSVEGMLSIIKCFDMCIGMRLHTLIYAAINSVPLIGLVYDPKINSFMEYTHQRHYVDVNEVTDENLKKMLDECVANYDTIKQDLKENYSHLKEKAKLNGKYAIELYEKGSVTL